MNDKIADAWDRTAQCNQKSDPYTPNWSNQCGTKAPCPRQGANEMADNQMKRIAEFTSDAMKTELIRARERLDSERDERMHSESKRYCELQVEALTKELLNSRLPAPIFFAVDPRVAQLEERNGWQAKRLEEASMKTMELQKTIAELQARNDCQVGIIKEMKLHANLVLAVCV